MRFNENIALSGSQVLLVPYDPHHVPRYHEWMEDAAIREATASDRLTLAEEYENQSSWREAPDKLTFIVCEPLPRDEEPADPPRDSQAVVAGEADSPDRMIGDINLFLTPWDGDDEERDRGEKGKTCVNAEVDIMIADLKHRGRGLGRATLAMFLLFIRGNLDAILAEYAGAGEASGAGPNIPELKDVVAKINANNQSSIKLFKSMGFSQRGGVNYFGEIEMVLEGLGKKGMVDELAAATSKCFYDRSRLKK
ncbi:GNAT domain-containing protein [Hypoxylon cercidicola]|nr:GNAT domain-containing protein [Hypoxylon cercidicola]